MSIQFFSKVEGGHIDMNCRQAIATALKSLDGKTAKITIEERKKKRSSNQNSFYWGYLIPPIVNMFNEHGNNVNSEQVHEYLKAEVGGLNQHVILPDGEVKIMAGSSTILRAMEFEDYLTKIRAWAASFGLILPFPNEFNN